MGNGIGLYFFLFFFCGFFVYKIVIFWGVNGVGRFGVNVELGLVIEMVIYYFGEGYYCNI